MKRAVIGAATLAVAIASLVAAREIDGGADGVGAGSEVIPLKEAKLNIEHNATDEDTGFQGFIDSEGWRRLDMRGPDGTVLWLEGRGDLGELGLTELFFESVEPANEDVPLDEVLETLPEGEYVISGNAQEAGERLGRTSGTAWARAGPSSTSRTRGSACTPRMACRDACASRRCRPGRTAGISGRVRFSAACACTSGSSCMR